MATTTETARLHSTLITNKPSVDQHREPLEAKGLLESVEHFDVTPIIGREFLSANLKEWLRAPDSDELLRDLAITSEYQ